MVAFLFLAPPLFLLAPLALLLAFSGPKTSREWIWILLAGGGSLKLVLDMGRADLPSRLIGTAGLLSAAAFVVVANLLPRLSTVVRGLIVVGVSAAGLATWILWYAIDLGPVDTAIADQIRRSVDLWLQGAAGDQVAAAKESAASVARLFPGMVALQALLGLGLSWRWYHRIASRPLPPPPDRFRAFRFNDHLIWGAILTLGLALVPLGEPTGRIAENLLVIWVGLYGARGLAVARHASRAWPLPGKLLMLAFAVLALPIALGTLVTLGLADTWLDFRNRPVPDGGNTDGSHSS